MSDLLGAFERLLDTEADPLAAIRAAGFADALRDLPLVAVEPLIRAVGRRGLDLPITDTLAARAIPAPSRALLAVLAAIEMAGLAERLLAMSIDHANTRVQFGKPIGRFQAIQQQLAVMAEQVVLMRIAAQSACPQGLDMPVETAAVAKSVASTAAPVAAGIAHVVHGAIGITAAFPLHRFTARLHALRMAHGSESYWNTALGAARLAHAERDSLAFIRSLERSAAGDDTGVMQRPDLR